MRRPRPDDRGHGPARHRTDRDGRARARVALRPAEWATIAYAGALLVLVAPNVSARYWTPKVVLVLLALVPGLVVLVRAAWARDRAAVAASPCWWRHGIDVWSPQPVLALLAPTTRHRAAVRRCDRGRVGTRAAAVACGGPHARLGRPRRGRGNTVMTWLQMSSAFSNGLFDASTACARLLGNPVHATAFLVAAFALTVERCREPMGETRTGRVGYFAACALFASGVQLSGGRIGSCCSASCGVGPGARGLAHDVIVVALGALGVGSHRSRTRPTRCRVAPRRQQQLERARPGRPLANGAAAVAERCRHRTRAVPAGHLAARHRRGRARSAPTR